MMTGTSYKYHPEGDDKKHQHWTIIDNYKFLMIVHKFLGTDDKKHPIMEKLDDYR